MARRLWLILLAMLLAGTAAWALTRGLPTLYQSVATFQINSQQAQPLEVRDGQGAPAANPEAVETILQEFRQRSFMERVVKALGLANEARFLGGAMPEAAGAEMAASMLLGDSRVILRPRTSLVDIFYVHTDRALTQRVTDGLLTEFMKQQVDQKMKGLRAQNQLLVAKAEELKQKLNGSELALQDYKARLATVSLEDRRNLLEEKLKALNLELAAAKSERLRLETEVEQLRHALGRPAALMSIPSVAQDPEVLAAQQKLALEEEAVAALQQRYRERHPQMITQRAQLEAARRSLTDALNASPTRLDSRYQAAVAREKSLQKATAEQEQSLLEMDGKVIPFRALQREYDSDRMLFEAVLQRLKESNLQLGVQTVNFQVVEPAAPAKAMASRRPLMIFGGALLGACLSAGAVAAAYGLKGSLASVEAVERILRLPVLAAIPKLPQPGRFGGAVAVRDRPASFAAESFRTLRSALLVLSHGRPQVVLTTSAMPGEGKSVSVVNLASALAQQGLKTLLVDADLRKPSLEAMLLPARKGRGGVGDYLLGGNYQVEATDQPNLFVLPAGKRLRNPAELLSGAAFAELIQQLRREYAWVLIDSAPVNVVSDTLNIVGGADLVCLVVRSNSTPRKFVERAIELLRRSDVRPDGIIFNWLTGWNGRPYHEYAGGVHSYGDDETYHEPEESRTNTPVRPSPPEGALMELRKVAANL